MDPLSIATSVASLIAAGSKLTAILTQISRLSDAPPLCKAILTEVCDTAAALRQIQNFLNGQLYVPPERREYVLLEHVSTALVGCVMTKDELETLLDGLGLVYAGSGITGVFDRVKWVRKETNIQRLVQRLQNHKASLNLILTIFQCSSSTQIQDSVVRLSSLVEEALSSHSALSIRMSRLEEGSTLRSATIPTSSVNDIESIKNVEQEYLGTDNASVTTITRIPEVLSEPEEQFILLPFPFDPELQASRVYRRLHLTHSDGHSATSITISTRQRAAASIFSALSLAEISNLSQYSLPIFIQEIGNNRWYIQVGRVSTIFEETGGTASRISLDVKKLDGSRTPYTMQPSSTGQDLMNAIGGPEHFLVCEHTKNVFRIENNKTLQEQGITEGARVHVVLRYRAEGRELGERSDPYMPLYRIDNEYPRYRLEPR
ncbi:uncharacterized protein LY89DRAFT_724461 [Mollisia scopiformis]|uniref:Ubiquitin-like domain-containing protein n=1 Tax=Mollisia scopiformis TaxID=149040 RepID=A0A132BB32_MOLSC|nr:uncharacterized protein LY89DRAFT_724461 [Mollisia scopiformis]KUJ09483.1 hypothetical protein LY89DRAFT_724461 [Mollisia scopiformis]